MILSKKFENFQRYKDVSLLFIKYGQIDVVRQSGIGSMLADDVEMSEKEIAKAEEFAKDLEKLGATYIKMGQLLSTRSDIFPEEFLKSLEKLQDDIQPFPFSQVEEIFFNEVGAKISTIFEYIDQIPLAAASIGQVHKGKLFDGREVVIKVQRPDVRNKIFHDIEVLENISHLLEKNTTVGKKYQVKSIISQLKKSLFQELDYKLESDNLKTLRKNLKKFKKIKVPKPIDDLTTSRVLTMEYVDGIKITGISPIAYTELDTKTLADELFHSYLNQIMVDGFFHADPHPGNILLTPEGKIALIDLGMTGRLSKTLQDETLNLLLAICEGRGEAAARIAIKIGHTTDSFKKDKFIEKVSDIVNLHYESDLKKIKAGRIVMEITKISADTGIRVPPEMTLIGKALLNLDKAVYTLDPGFCPRTSVQKYAACLMNKRMTKGMTAGTVFSNLLELRQFIESIPPKLNKIISNLAENELRVHVDAIDETKLMVGFQKIANRITLGLLSASMIIGGAMIMNIESSFTVLGYPALALFLFLGATVFSMTLIYTILFNDSK